MCLACRCGGHNQPATCTLPATCTHTHSLSLHLSLCQAAEETQREFEAREATIASLRGEMEAAAAAALAAQEALREESRKEVGAPLPPSFLPSPYPVKWGRLPRCLVPVLWVLYGTIRLVVALQPQPELAAGSCKLLQFPAVYWP